MVRQFLRPERCPLRRLPLMAALPLMTVLPLPVGAVPPSGAADGLPPPVPVGSEPAAALLLSPGERRDRAELALREQAGLVRWKWFNATAVDWAGWKLHPGGVRITLVKASAADLGLRGSAASSVAVQCESLRLNWRIDGDWQPWQAPMPGSIGQRIVLDLCSNTLDGPAVPVVAPAAAPAVAPTAAPPLTPPPALSPPPAGQPAARD